MGRTYRTAQGKQLDIEQLRLQNELIPAIGNMRVNARGDQLGAGGKVIKSREQMLDDHYSKNNTSGKPNNTNSGQADVIPTKGGKSKRVDNFEPGNIEPDKVAPPKVAKITPPAAPILSRSVPETAVAAPEEPLEDDFIDPVVGEVEEEVEPTPNATPNKTTGIAAGGSSLKGGLARAVAKTQQYEDSKNKPKRL
jgi:hypothetical protein